MADLLPCPVCRSTIRGVSTSCPHCWTWIGPGDPPPWKDIGISPVMDRVDPETRARWIEERRKKR